MRGFLQRPAGSAVNRAVLAFCCLVLSACGALAQLASGRALSTRSYSGQFVVRGNPQPAGLPLALMGSPATNWVRLEPRLLALSCERIKEAMLRELDAADHWRGKVFLNLHPIRNLYDPILVTPAQFADGWVYYVDLPDAVEPDQFFRALVRVLLQEWVNRAPRSAAAEVPAWLSEGLPEQFLSDATREFVVRPAEGKVGNLMMRSLTRQARRTDPLTQAHEFLRTHTPMTLDQLSWPQAELFAGEALWTYRYSSQLFLHELLRLRNGKPALCAMLDGLAQHLNWQTAFFRAFGAHFQRPLDLEKWWDLQAVHFTNRDLSQTWNREDSFRKLSEVLRARVQIRAGSNAPVVQADAPLQGVLLEGDYAGHRDLWPFKIQQLQTLRFWLTPEVVPLADEYRRTLEAYVRRMERGRSTPADMANAYEQSRIAQATARQLDRLDRERENRAVRYAPPAPAPAPAKQAGSQRR